MTKDEALKMAIEVMYRNSPKIGLTQELEEAINACKEALEQPAQEPVATVKVLDGYDIQVHWLNEPPATGLLYTHPHQWQGLTDDEIDQIIDDVFSKSAIEKNGVKTCSVHEGFRAIEQALKEKNT